MTPDRLKRAAEHLSGQHNQKSHGNKYGSADAIRGNVKRLGKDKEALKRMAQKVRQSGVSSNDTKDAMAFRNKDDLLLPRTPANDKKASKLFQKLSGRADSLKQQRRRLLDQRPKGFEQKDEAIRKQLDGINDALSTLRAYANPRNTARAGGLSERAVKRGGRKVDSAAKPTRQTAQQTGAGGKKIIGSTGGRGGASASDIYIARRQFPGISESRLVEAIDLTPPAAVQKAAMRGLMLRRKYGRGGLDTRQAGAQGIGSGVARARDLASGKAVSPATIRRMVAFFARHEANKDTPPEEGNGQIAWLLWGGDAGRAWANSKARQLEAVQDMAARLSEHLGSKHNQKSHGNKYGSADAIRANVKRLGKDKEALKRMVARARGDKDFQARVKAGAQGKKSIVDIRKRQVNGKKAGSFDEKAEREKLMTPDGKPKNGVTRDQMKRFFDRRNAVETAARSKRRGGATVKDDLDGAIRDGMTVINKKTGGWWQLSKPDGSTTLNLKRPEEINYLLTVLNKGNFAKNY